MTSDYCRPIPKYPSVSHSPSVSTATTKAKRRKKEVQHPSQPIPNLSQVASGSVSSSAGHKPSDRNRNRTMPSVINEFCVDEHIHNMSLIFKERMNPIPKTPRPITRCYPCGNKFRVVDRIVGCVKTRRLYPHNGILKLSTEVSNAYAHLQCLHHKDFQTKSVHICNYMNAILSSEEYQLILKHTEADSEDNQTS